MPVFMPKPLEHETVDVQLAPLGRFPAPGKAEGEEATLLAVVLFALFYQLKGLEYASYVAVGFLVGILPLPAARALARRRLLGLEPEPLLQHDRPLGA